MYALLAVVFTLTTTPAHSTPVWSEQCTSYTYSSAAELPAWPLLYYIQHRGRVVDQEMSCRRLCTSDTRCGLYVYRIGEDNGKQCFLAPFSAPLLEDNGVGDYPGTDWHASHYRPTIGSKTCEVCLEGAACVSSSVPPVNSTLSSDQIISQIQLAWVNNSGVEDHHNKFLGQCAKFCSLYSDCWSYQLQVGLAYGCTIYNQTTTERDEEEPTTLFKVYYRNRECMPTSSAHVQCHLHLAILVLIAVTIAVCLENLYL